MDIISKRSGPRPEDVKAKRHLQENWGTIAKLADVFSGGTYSAGRQRQPEPKAEGLIIVDQAARRQPDDPEPYLRISMNGRVVLADLGTGRQLHFLGQLKRIDGAVRFVIATAANGFFTPLDAEIHDKIADLEGRTVNRDYSEETLAENLKARLNLT
ncbi:MAG: hypothetical protein H5U18_11945 [Rhodobacteraceae bacterium]|nr:hypothetical protein [Paracoccaceae bacterium]